MGVSLTLCFPAPSVAVLCFQFCVAALTHPVSLHRVDSRKQRFYLLGAFLDAKLLSASVSKIQGTDLVSLHTIM